MMEKMRGTSCVMVLSSDVTYEADWWILLGVAGCLCGIMVSWLAKPHSHICSLGENSNIGFDFQLSMSPFHTQFLSGITIFISCVMSQYTDLYW